jgi:allantoicase
MGEGWETARRRGGGNEWVVVKLGAPGLLDHVVIDTSYFVGNSPAAATVSVRAGEAWSTVLDRARLQPDTAHRFPVASDAPVTHLRVDIHPDGGLARLRVVGTALLAPDG